MKKLKNILFSISFTVIFLLIFALSIAVATFLENSHGTDFAKYFIYNAKWFEFILILLIVNFIGIVFKKKLGTKKKWSILLFHSAFICMLLGAAITRYFGFEGHMHIRQAETTNKIVTDNKSVKIIIDYNREKTEKEFVVDFKSKGDKQLDETIPFGNEIITIQSQKFVPNAMFTIEENEHGNPAVAIFTSDSKTNRNMDFILFNNDSISFAGHSFAFEKQHKNADISFSKINDRLYFKSRTKIFDANNQKIFQADSLYLIDTNLIYKLGSSVFIIKKFYPSVKKKLIARDENGSFSTNALVLNITNKNKTEEIAVFESKDKNINPVNCTINDIKITVIYAPQIVRTPFNLTLQKFELERYPGSMSPSSYASHILLTDSLKDLKIPYQISMNKILNYRGYRFFQSSYDDDELGTVLLVNHDFWGTLVSYIGYFLLFFGMIMTLFNKNSRFRTLMRMSNELERKRKLGAILLVLTLSLFGNFQLQAQENTDKKNHLKNLNELLVQDTNQGRVEPFGTYATDVFRKISKKNNYNAKLAPEIIIGMMANPTLWKDRAIIKVANPALEKELGAKKGMISYNAVFDKNSNYRLRNQVEKAYQKAESNRNKYEKEIINIDERINICHMIYAQGLLAFFPDSIDKNKQWSFTSELSETSIPYLKMQKYIHSYGQALIDGNWNKANQDLNEIKNYQLKYAHPNSFTVSRIKAEILYNKLNVFNNLMIAYALLGFSLLLLHFIVIFKPNAGLEKALNYAIYPLGILLLIYTAGLIMRWYISGHAPWSNGYESMIFVGWASSLSGLLFARKSSLAFSVSALLSAIALSVAAMSWMNPEITNLVPVLKSYWLIIHVAIITSSYGFLAMGAILGLLNLILMVARNKKNALRVNSNIQEISYIIEMALIVGLFLLTIGTFIGGIWANESWGRYWGWDAKETWALVSILVYAIVLHLRLIPRLNNSYVLSSMSIIAFFSVIMTFLGVNYYLTGMHSYGQGTPPTIPTIVYIGLGLLLSLIYFAYRKEKRSEK